MDHQRGSPELLLSQSQHEAVRDGSDSSRVFEVAPSLRGLSKGKPRSHRIYSRTALGVFASLTAVLLLIGICSSALRNRAEGRGIGRRLSANEGLPESEALAYCQENIADSSNGEEPLDLSVGNLGPPAEKRPRLETTAADSRIILGEDEEARGEPPSTSRQPFFRAWESPPRHSTPQGDVRTPHGVVSSLEQVEPAHPTSYIPWVWWSLAEIQGAGTLPAPPNPHTQEDISATWPLGVQGQRSEVHTTPSDQSESNQRSSSDEEVEAAEALLMLHPQEPLEGEQTSSASQPSVEPSSATPMHFLPSTPFGFLSTLQPILFPLDPSSSVLSIVVPASSSATLPAASSPLLPRPEGGPSRHFRKILKRQEPSSSTPSASSSPPMESSSQSTAAPKARDPSPPSNTSEHRNHDSKEQRSERRPPQREHPYSRVPHVSPRDQVKRRFCPSRVTEDGVPCEFINPQMNEMRALLSQESLTGEHLNRLAHVLHRFLAYFNYRENSEVGVVQPSVALRALGRRFVMFDLAVSALQALGETLPAPWWNDFVSRIPTEYEPLSQRPGRNLLENINLMMLARLREALKILKTGTRPPKKELVEIKKFLFTSFNSPHYFKLSRWDPWRADDRDFEQELGEADRETSNKT